MIAGVAVLGFYDTGQPLPYPRRRCPACNHPCRVIWASVFRCWHWLCVGERPCSGTPAGMVAADPRAAVQLDVFETEAA